MPSEAFDDFSLPVARRLDQLCRQFEKGWQAGESPRLEDYLAQVPEQERATLLEELLSLELEYRRKAREPIPLEGYLDRFPRETALVARVWRDSDLPGSFGSSHFLLTGTYHSDGGPDAATDTAAQQRDPILREVAAPVERRRIGRYRIEKVLGRGAFGTVYLALDEQLKRQVAVKVPHLRLIARPDVAEVYLAEARTVANLDHPNIVPVHDVGSTADCPCYVVSKYIEGADLATRIKERRLPYIEAAEMVAVLAEALHHAHKQGLVHRDIKPSNIMLDHEGTPYLVDFGLALREENIGKGPTFVGTPAYMSPEQARGEGHRVDGRSDLFSLGVVLYELLAGRRPFQAATRAEVLEQVTSYEFRPLRQYDEKLPKELERICARAMAKRTRERYSTAYDLAEDLRHFLAEHAETESAGGSQTASATPSSAMMGLACPSSSSGSQGFSSESQPLKVVPKGLRSFDAHDSDFFLALLPGPRDRRGLPEGVRFWKIHIEEPDPDQTFAVGLLYGPSGCGKSSLVKAGLLPHLSEDVIPIYLEATANDTETHLLERLRKHFPALADNLNLQESLATLRQGQGLPHGKKVLLVLDQFEQWLHAHRGEENTDLVQALRQCDGGRVQCLVMVRDDFWLAISRFMRELEVRLVEGHNSALVDLFDLDHARKILAAFGQAFGKVPTNVKDTSREQEAFLKQSVQGLAEDSKVICVRLALFAEMMKVKPWTSATLKEVGGTEGVGVTFLEETFSSSTAAPKHRYHQNAARAVLKTLLPEAGSDIKGGMRSREELLEASGHGNHPRDFEELLGILDAELKLITPSDRESITGEPGRFYQLTHDYLVTSLRQWLTRKQRETRRGRAELRLAERASLWTSKPEKHYLPTWWEWLNIRLCTHKPDWTPSQRKMMVGANRYYTARSLLLTVALLLLSWTSWEGFAMLRAHSLHDGLLVASTEDVPKLIEEMGPYRRWVNPLLRETYANAEANHDARKQLHASLALLPEDSDQIDYLAQRLLGATPTEVLVIREALQPYRSEVEPRCWRALERHGQTELDQKLQAASALALYAPNEPRWEHVSEDVARALDEHFTSSSPVR